MPDLAAFQRAFAAALRSDDQPEPAFRRLAFTVYRNTSARGAVEALRAAFPTVDMLVGEEMFTQAALDYRDENPPISPILSDYGVDFPSYLDRQPWTVELPYLADVARLDRLWLESFLAADLVFSPEPVAGGALTLVKLHPATRFAWLETPAMTIWQAHRTPNGLNDLDLKWKPEGVLITRRSQQVGAQSIDPVCYRLLLSLATSTRVDDCVTAVAAAFPEADVPALLGRCVTSEALIIQ